MSGQEMRARQKKESLSSTGSGGLPVYVPAVDIFESAEALVLVADMPGVGPENIEIDIKDGILTITGNMTVENTGERMLVQEFRPGNFHRQFAVGRTINQARIEASIRNGVLTLTLPKAEPAEPRKIFVKAD